jgi:hypothetical protein
VSRDTAETRGLTLREILLEIRADLKEHLEKGHANTPTRAEIYGSLILMFGLLLAVIR